MAAMTKKLAGACDFQKKEDQKKPEVVAKNAPQVTSEDL